MITSDKYRQVLADYAAATGSRTPLFLTGEALDVLRQLPEACFDFCMTSPPYWGHRQYASTGIGLEDDFNDYIDNLTTICDEVRRVLKPTGSFWLNIGDSYQRKCLVGIPWRIALRLTDNQGWHLRNDVIWNKVKGGPDSAKDKLRTVHEHVFHFTKNKSYFYDVDAIRSNPKKTKVLNGAVVSATGVSGVHYRRQIELSTELSDDEKQNALAALENILKEMIGGKLADFRMIIRGQQRATHSDSERVSGRARELREKGFYFLRYHPKGSKPSDVWDILPEDTQKRESHFAPYPEDLCKIPMLATCPEDGIALDPFCGTGTTMLVAFQLGRKSVGIDVAGDYIDAARDRCNFLL
jgi:DNA modification methylase